MTGAGAAGRGRRKLADNRRKAAGRVEQGGYGGPGPDVRGDAGDRSGHGAYKGNGLCEGAEERSDKRCSFSRGGRRC